jgi:hypothetical protein
MCAESACKNFIMPRTVAERYAAKLELELEVIKRVCASLSSKSVYLQAERNDQKRIVIFVHTNESVLLRRLKNGDTVVGSFVLDDHQPHASLDEPQEGMIKSISSQLEGLLHESNVNGYVSEFEESKPKPKATRHCSSCDEYKEMSCFSKTVSSQLKDLLVESNDDGEVTGTSSGQETYLPKPKAILDTKDLIENIINDTLADTIEELANPIKDMQQVPSKLEQGFMMAGNYRGELLQAICKRLKLKSDSDLDEFLAIVDSKNESCEGAPVSREVYALCCLIDIKRNLHWSSLMIRECEDSNETEHLYMYYQAELPDATSQEIMKAVKMHRSRQQMVGSEVGQEDDEETFRQDEEEMARLEEQLVVLEEDQEEDEARSATEDEDELKPPGTFRFSSTSPLSGSREQAIQDLIYLICRHTYMKGVLFNTVDYRRLLNSTELVIDISSFSVNTSLGPLISKNAKKNGWFEDQSCFAMSLNSALLYAVDSDGRALINFDLFEDSHEANAFDNGVPPTLVSKAVAYARQIVELANGNNVTLIGQGKHVNNILEAAIEEKQLQSTTNYFGIPHPTNGSANAFGNNPTVRFNREWVVLTFRSKLFVVAYHY